MATSYNRFAGQSIERLGALSDGIFAVAMTLLVLDLRTPVKENIHSGADLCHALIAMSPQMVSYLMSFLTLSIFWNGQQAQLNRFEHGDRHLTWIHLAFLFGVSTMPFSTRLLAEFIEYPSALICYWVNILFLGLVLFISWRYALGAGLVDGELPDEVNRAMQRRILLAQALYALGAALCVFSTYLSIGFIVLVQLNFAFAPRIKYISEI
jgi:uncharacterized membrane protein